VVVGTALKRIGRPAVSALIGALKNPDPELRARAATLLSQIAPDDDGVAGALRNAASDRDAEVRRRVVAALDAVNVPVAALVEA
jgi:HEAT repeat protein